jgi:hypothetical protein
MNLVFIFPGLMWIFKRLGGFPKTMPDAGGAPHGKPHNAEVYVIRVIEYKAINYDVTDALS